MDYVILSLSWIALAVTFATLVFALRTARQAVALCEKLRASRDAYRDERDRLRVEVATLRQLTQ